MNKKSLKSFIFDFIRICTIIAVCIGLTWTVTLADTVDDTTPVEQVSESDSIEAIEASNVEENSGDQSQEQTATETPHSEPTQPLNEEQGSEEQTSDTSSSEQTASSSENQDTENSSSTEATSGGILGGIIDTAKDIINTVTDVIVDTVTDILTIPPTSEEVVPDVEELLDMTPEEIALLATSTVIFIEEETETGKIVTVTAPNEDPEMPIVDVLASTTIPEIYKVGEEDKIQIKWTNNGDQEMSFNAIDTNSNGYIDYVEWTIPHLSTQVFEIIFISKAFQLDSNKNIVADIFDKVGELDGTYVSLTDGQYIRATFEKILDSTKDITVYARATNSGSPASLEVFPLYDDGNGNLIEGSSVALFESIDEEGTYKVFLDNLSAPTDMFDVLVSGNIDVDLVIDPIAIPLFTAEANGPIDDGATFGGASPGIQGVDYPGPNDDVDLAGFALTTSGPITVDTIVDTIGGGSLTVNADLTATTITDAPIIVVGTSLITADINVSNTNSVGITIDPGATLTLVGNLNSSNSSYSAIVNNGTITDIQGTFTYSGGVHGIENAGTIIDITGTIDYSGNGFEASGIYNTGTITDISGSITNSSTYGINNTQTGTILDITGTLTNNGNTGIANSGSITSLNASFTNSGYTAVNNSSNGSIGNISGTTTDVSIGGYSFSNDGGAIDEISADIYVYSGGSGIYNLNNGSIDIVSGNISGGSGTGIVQLGGQINQVTGTTSGSIAIYNAGGVIDNISAAIDGSIGIMLESSGIVNSITNSVFTANTGIEFYNDGSNSSSAYIGEISSSTGLVMNLNSNTVTTGGAWNISQLIGSGGISALNVGHNLTVENEISNVPLIVVGANITIFADVYNDTTTLITVNSGGSLIYTGTMNNQGTGIYVNSGGTLTDMSGTITNSGDYATAIINYGGVITDISGTITNSANTGNGFGYGVENYGGVITDISGTIYNSGTGYGVYNYDLATIENISGTIQNSGGYAGIYNDSLGTIYDISGIITNITDADSRAIYNAGTIQDISGIFQNQTSPGYGLENYGTVTDISGYALSSYATAIDNYSVITNFSGININAYSSPIGLESTSIIGKIINLPGLPFGVSGFWLNTIGDHDWDNSGNWLLGYIPNKTTDNIILLADMVLSSNISNPVYFAPGGYTLYGGGLYTVDNSIYGIDGVSDIGINAGTYGADVYLDGVNWTGDIYGGDMGGIYGGSVSITLEGTLDLSSKIIQAGIGDINGYVFLNYDSIITSTSTYIYEAGELIINTTNYYDISGNSAMCTNNTSAGTSNCAWNGLFNPLVFYYNNAADDGDWNNLLNWWNDVNFTEQATVLPNALNQVFIYGDITQNLGDPAIAKTIIFNGDSSSAIDITVSDSVIFNDTSSNLGTLTLSGSATFNESSSNMGTVTAATSTFYEDLSSTVGGTIVGFLQRIFTASATTTRDFTSEGGRDDWLIKAVGAIVVDVFDATYNLTNNIFQALAGAIFQSERGGDSNPAGQPTPIITFDLGETNGDGDIIKWDPVIDWDTATTTGCIYSYDNFQTTQTLNCSLGGSDLPRPSAGDHELSLRGIDINGNITETASYEFTYNNTAPIYTMCGSDLLDEPRQYYYLNQNVTGPCTITATSTTTVLKGNLVATSTGYTVTGNIVGNGKNINLQNITITGTVDSNGGNIITSSATIGDEVISNGGDITISSSILSATSTSQGGDITITSATTTALVSTATSTGATAGSVTINSSTVGSVVANGVSGTNGGNGGVIIVATSTTGILYANGANGTTNGGDGGNITITNSFATPVGSGIFSNGGNSTSCGSGGDAGIVTLTSSTYGTITSNGGTGADSGCPGSGGTSGQSRTPAVSGSYTPPSSGGSQGGQSQGGNQGGSSSGSSRSLIKNILNPLNFTPITPFTPFSPSFIPTTVGQTIIPDPFKNFQPPGIINLATIPVNFLTNISRFLFAPLPTSLIDALASSPRLAAYIGSVGVSTEQNIATLASAPVVLQEPLSDESTPPGLFIIRSGSNTLASYASYDASVGGLAQLVKTSPNQSLAISLIPQSDGEVTALYLGQNITFTRGSLFASASIQTPSTGGRYILKTASSPLPLLIEVTEPVSLQEPKKENIFMRIWKWLTT